MQIHVSIGENHRFELREALLVYGDRQRSFVTRHQVKLHKDAPPTLEPAQPPSLGFLESLVRSLAVTTLSPSKALTGTAYTFFTPR